MLPAKYLRLVLLLKSFFFYVAFPPWPTHLSTAFGSAWLLRK